MTQYIAPNMAMAMQYSNQQGMDPSNRYGSGILSLADGGFIGGGNIQGQAMPGGRTGFGFFDKAKKFVKKIVPKELAGIMQVAAPFVAPHSMLGAAALSGLGQYKGKGKINPLQLMMSMAPGLEGRHLGGFRPEGMTKNENVMRHLMGRLPGGQKMDKLFFGAGDDPLQKGYQGIFGKGGEGYVKSGGLGDLLSRGTEAVLMKGKPGERVLDKTMVVTLGLGGMSYLEAKKQMQLAGKGDLENDYGITEEVWEATDWSEAFKDNATLGNAQGGLPRTRQAMGTSQFPMTSTRSGMAWGSDQGEGLGGEEVEADMRFTGGFMPYGQKPKADDVPARLSKDEFVFTDEAVKGAGQGDVNVGAERLFNIMKQLEQTGAQNMEGIFNNPLAMS